MRDKIIVCAIRWVGVTLVIATLVAGAKYLDWKYDDTKTVLGMFNAYFPEMFLLLCLGAGVFVFYRMDASDENDFTFAAFFQSQSGYDIYRFGYFWLLIIAGWVLFIHAWRDKPMDGITGIVLGAFVVKGIADSIGSAFGKQPDAAK
jgi:hypothetical protein